MAKVEARQRRKKREKRENHRKKKTKRRIEKEERTNARKYEKIKGDRENPRTLQFTTGSKHAQGALPTILVKENGQQRQGTGQNV